MFVVSLLRIKIHPISALDKFALRVARWGGGGGNCQVR